MSAILLNPRCIEMAWVSPEKSFMWSIVKPLFNKLRWKGLDGGTFIWDNFLIPLSSQFISIVPSFSSQLQRESQEPLTEGPGDWNCKDIPARRAAHNRWLHSFMVSFVWIWFCKSRDSSWCYLFCTAGRGVQSNSVSVLRKKTPRDAYLLLKYHFVACFPASESLNFWSKRKCWAFHWKYFKQSAC